MIDNVMIEIHSLNPRARAAVRGLITWALQDVKDNDGLGFTVEAVHIGDLTVIAHVKTAEDDAA